MGADGSDHGVDFCTAERPQHPHNHCPRSGRGRTTTSGETESPTVATCATATVATCVFIRWTVAFCWNRFRFIRPVCSSDLCVRFSMTSTNRHTHEEGDDNNVRQGQYVTISVHKGKKNRTAVRATQPNTKKTNARRRTSQHAQKTTHNTTGCQSIAQRSLFRKVGRDTTFRGDECETTRVRKRSMRRSVAVIFLKGIIAC